MLIDVISGKTYIDIYVGPNLFIDNIKYEVYILLVILSMMFY